MKIVITGASGFVAGLLVPLLQARGAQLLLVGREPKALKQRFPGLQTCGYDALARSAAGFDMVLHLATRNNNEAGTIEEFRRGNVEHLLATYDAAAAAGVTSFIDISTVHALDARNDSPYAKSKREGTRALGERSGPRVETVYLATVYGEKWAGKLSFLNSLPRALAKPIFSLFAALKPTVHAGQLADHLMQPARAEEVLLTDGQAQNPFYRFVTRALNLLAGLTILTAFSWLLIGLWVAIRLNSPGPGLFVQERLGRNGQVFSCYKFRTMVVGTRHLGTHEVSSSAITSLGKFLRATKLDELPQAWNLLRNDMTLIGPRPGLPVQTELREERTRRSVLELTPGISGLAQVNGIDMSDPLKLSIWDARYRALQCLILDAKLLLATVRGAGRGDPAQNNKSIKI